MAQRSVQGANAERLTHEPGMQIQHQQPPVCGPLVIQRSESLLDHLPVPVYINTPVPQGIAIIQRQCDGQGVQLARRRRRRAKPFTLWDFEGIRLLVVDPVADLAHAHLGQQLGRSRGLSRLWPQPADRGLARGTG